MNEIPLSDVSVKQVGEEYEPADLVVDLPHLDLVQHVLCNDLRVWPRTPGSDQVERSEALGLALLRGLENLGGRPKGSSQSKGGPTFADLDAVLDELRSVLGKRFGGWVPALGKNRHVGKPVTIEDEDARNDILELQAGDGCVGIMCPMVNPLVTAVPTMPSQVPEPTFGPAGNGVRVGILDTELYPHPRLFRRVPDDDFVAAMVDRQKHGSVWLPWEGHATFVADLVLRQAPSAELVMRPVLGGDNGRANLWDAANQIVGFADAGIDILNLSLGGRTSDSRPPLLFTRALERLGRDVLVVAAAGNHGVTAGRCRPVWPAALPDVIAVGATDEPYSPKLPWVTCTARGDAVAAYLSETVIVPTRLPPRLHHQPSEPGVRLSEHQRQDLHGKKKKLETRTFNGYASWSGTSFAAATVSGAVAAVTKPGRTARVALEELLKRSDGVVTRFVYEHDCDCA